MSQPNDTEQRVRAFNDRLADDSRSGASEVQDFMLKMSYAFPSTDVLVPAPMAVSILGQLTMLATSTDFKLDAPRDGFKYVIYGNSFRATITQLVDTGVRALNDSYTNFDGMNKQCSIVRSVVNDIIQLLVGNDSNTPEQNDIAIQRHLPSQVESLSRIIEECLRKAERTHNAFRDLLNLTMEIHASCVATRGMSEREIQEAKLKKANLEKKEVASREMKRIQEQALDRARCEYNTAQTMWTNAVDEAPNGAELAALGSGMDTLANMLVLGLQCYMLRRTPPRSTSEKDETTTPTSPSDANDGLDISDITDPGYKHASVLRTCSVDLSALLTAGPDGRLDWDAIKSQEAGGCLDVAIKCGEVVNSLIDNNSHTSDATKTTIELAVRGSELARMAGDMIPPSSPDSIELLREDVSTWQYEVVKFASTADLKSNAPLLNLPAFVAQPPSPPSQSMFSKAKIAMEAAQYKVAVTQAQLNASRESSKAATDKLMEVNKELGYIMAELATIDIQKYNWEEITGILLKAIGFLSELKTYLKSLVHFFDSVHNFVSLSFKGTADQFITVVKKTSGIEDTAYGSRMKVTNGGITLDAWSRETIYKYALSTAKLSKMVQHISGMYVTLYDGHVHPGVNMLLSMGKLVGAQDPAAVALAGKQIQDWAQSAKDQITQLIAKQMRASEDEIEARMKELEKSFGVILPRSSKIEGIARAAEKRKVEEVTSTIAAAASANSILRRDLRI